MSNRDATKRLAVSLNHLYRKNLIKLHAYAIKTEGIAVDTSAMKDDPEEFASYVALLEGTKANTPSERQKCQAIFDALVSLAVNTEVLKSGYPATDYKPLDILCECRIQNCYFTPHLTLMGKRFSSELGV